MNKDTELRTTVKYLVNCEAFEGANYREPGHNQMLVELLNCEK